MERVRWAAFAGNTRNLIRHHAKIASTESAFLALFLRRQWKCQPVTREIKNVPIAAQK